MHAVISRARAANLRASSFGSVSACVAQLVVRPISPSADSAFRAPFPHTFFLFFCVPAAVSSLPAACLPACLPACLRNPLATRFGCVSARLAALSRAPNCAAGCQQVVRPALHFPCLLFVFLLAPSGGLALVLRALLPTRVFPFALLGLYSCRCSVCPPASYFWAIAHLYVGQH